MAENLSDALRGLHAAHESSAAATPAGPALELDVVTRRVRRRRAARAVGTGAVVIALVGAVAVGAAAARSTWWTPQPAATAPAPTVTSSPAPNGSPTADADQTQAVTSSPYLPTAEPMPAGLLEQTDATWNLVSYASRDGSHPAVLYLVGSDGRLVEVPSPVVADGDAGSAFEPRVVGWLPGTSFALVRSEPGRSDNAAVHVVDLLTGEPSATFEGAGSVYPYVGFVGDGTSDVLVEVWSPESHSVSRLYRGTVDGKVRAELSELPGPDLIDVVAGVGGTRVALLASTGVTVLDAATLEVAWAVTSDSGVGGCYNGAWDAAGHLMAVCSSEVGGDPQYWRLAEGAVPRQLGASDGDGSIPPGESLSPVLHLGDLTAFGDGMVGDLGTAMWLLTPDGTLSALPGLAEANGCTDVAVAGRFACQITTYSGPDGEGAHSALVRFDPMTGDDTLLLDVVDPARSWLGLVPIAW